MRDSRQFRYKLSISLSRLLLGRVHLGVFYMHGDRFVPLRSPDSRESAVPTWPLTSHPKKGRVRQAHAQPLESSTADAPQFIPLPRGASIFKNSIAGINKTPTFTAIWIKKDDTATTVAAEPVGLRARPWWRNSREVGLGHWGAPQGSRARSRGPGPTPRGLPGPILTPKGHPDDQARKETRPVQEH